MIFLISDVASIILALAPPGWVWLKVVSKKTGLRPFWFFSLPLLLLTASAATLALAVISPQVAGANYSQQRLRGIDANILLCIACVALAIRSKHTLTTTLITASGFLLGIWVYLGVVNVASEEEVGRAAEERTAAPGAEPRRC
jgi:hypothetical protein